MNDDVQVRLCAAQVLGRLDAQNVVGPLAAALRQDQPAVRREAALSLARLGGAAKEAADALAEAANDPDPSVRRAAVEALAAVTDR
jgi:HEAT repeat protein